jgi:hypothetical protein
MGRLSPELRSRSTFGRSPVRESRTPGSVRGDRGNPVPYRDEVCADRGDDAQDLRPVRPDEGDVDAAGDHRFQRRIGGRLAEAVEPAVLEVRDSRRELEAKQAAQPMARSASDNV